MARQNDNRDETSSGHRESSVSAALGESEAFLEFQRNLSRAARVNRPVLLIGERGTGKELAASRVHNVSDRWQGPFVALNCAALSPSLIESELFGHEEGAFTGATRKRPGRFELADEGTLFLDEIGSIPLETQEKILRVVEYGVFERVGGTQPVDVDVRIVGATNADLPALARRGEFKQDLLDRLSFDVLFLPPLRQRKGDIFLLANHFASRMAFELGREEVPQFSEEAVLALENHAWPGNIRELKNVVERAVYQAESNVIDEISFDPFQPPFPVSLSDEVGRSFSTMREMGEMNEAGGGPITVKSYSEAVRDLEVTLLRKALHLSRHNQRKAAEALGMTYHQFRWLYQKHREALEDSDR